jgi:methyl-accepting chemotaxis protein
MLEPSMIRNIKIGTRATLAFTFIAIITLILGLFSLVQINAISVISNDISERRLVLVSLSSELQRDFLTRRLAVGSLVDESDPSRVSSIEQRIAELDNEFIRNMEQLNQLINTARGKALSEQINSAHQNYINSYQKFTEILSSGDKVAAIDFRQKVIGPQSDILTSELDAFIQFQQDQAKTGQANALEIQANSKFTLVILIIFAFLSSIGCGVIFSRSLTQPISQLVSFANKIATGDLTSHLHDRCADEPAELARAMGEMQKNLRTTLQEINQAAALLASTSEELSVVTEQSTKNLHSQSHELAQAATAVTEMTAAVEEVARNASETSRSSDNANTETHNGKVLLEKTIVTIERMMREVSNSQSGVGELALRVKDIASVLDVIRGIAEQTNLLALNAAIEAARAGESGRGFAVVADEVRALAHRTQQSTKQIETMISSIQADTTNTVTAIKASADQANSTLTIAHQAGTAFDTIANNINFINQQNITIATAVEEQAMVAREVDRNLVNIRDIAVQTSAGAQQTSASSEELAKLAQGLNQLVLKFTL